MTETERHLKNIRIARELYYEHSLEAHARELLLLLADEAVARLEKQVADERAALR